MTMNRANEALKVTIANAASLSGTVEILGRALVGIQMPSAWTAANLTFKGSADGVTFYDLYDDAGSEVTVTAAASRMIVNSSSLEKLAACRYIQIRSGTTATPVAQGAARDLYLSVKS